MKILCLPDPNLFLKESKRTVDRDKDFMSISFELQLKSGATYTEQYASLLRSTDLTLAFAKAFNPDMWASLKDSTRDETIDFIVEFINKLPAIYADHQTYDAYLNDQTAKRPSEAVKANYEKYSEYFATEGYSDMLHFYTRFLISNFEEVIVSSAIL